jgi:NAD(P)-dependent dehydrogenase (short-subunit alcohol dehydrogenase family)
MARILVTGSSEGLGLMAGQRLIDAGHEVYLHGRNGQRSRDARAAAPRAAGVVTGDFSTLAGARAMADEANAAGRFDAVIHNAGVGYRESRRIESEPGVPLLFMVNVLAPYAVTALMQPPSRLIYLSSGMHHGAQANIDDLLWTRRSWNGSSAYAESKLWDVVLAFAVARHWPDVLSNALEPGWVATRMGGPGAPDDLGEGSLTQAWLAVSDDALARSSGQYFRHRRPREPNPAARDPALQDALLARCAELSGVELGRRDSNK